MADSHPRRRWRFDFSTISFVVDSCEPYCCPNGGCDDGCDGDGDGGG